MKTKRYVAGLQNAKDKLCFKDLAEFDKLNEAMKCANKAATKERAACVFDRLSAKGIIYRTDRG